MKRRERGFILNPTCSRGSLSPAASAGSVTITGALPLAQVTTPTFPGVGAITITGTTPIASVSDAGPLWTQDALNTSASWKGSAFGNASYGRVVAYGNNGATVVVSYSDDGGDNWSSAATPPSGFTPVVNALAYGGGVWLMGGDFVNHATSSDGSTWTNRTHTSYGFTICWFGSSNFVIAATSGSSLRTTSDGVTWTSRSVPGGALHTGSVRGAGDSSGYHVCGGSGGFGPANTTTFISSDDGVTWSSGGSLPSSFSTSGANGFAAGNGAFIAIGPDNKVAYSTDHGATWSDCTTSLSSFLPTSTTWAAAVYMGTRWLLFSTINGANQSVILKSTDNGDNWTQTTNQQTWTTNVSWSLGYSVGVATDRSTKYVIIGQQAAAQTAMQRGTD